MLQIPVSGIPSFMAPGFGGIYPLDKQHQLIPEGFHRLCPAFVHVDDRQVEEALFEPQVVDNQAAGLHMKYFHGGTSLIDKNISAPVADIHTHLIGHNTAQGIETFPHITRIRVQVIPVGFIQAEHGLTALI